MARALDLRALTLMHVMRVPVEWALHQLHVEGYVPQVMTWEGPPNLFQTLRGLIDRARGRRSGRFLLGSASLDLLRQSSESLAGRVAILELSPIHALEATAIGLDPLWMRGGFPESRLRPRQRPGARVAWHRGPRRTLGHPVVGASWEGAVIEWLLANAPEAWEPSFYRTSAGAEIDLLLTPPGERPWAIEIKRSLSPSLERGFHLASKDVEAARRFVVYPGTERYPAAKDVEAIGVTALASLLRERAPSLT